MSKLTIISDKDMVKLLKSLGFAEIRQNGSHKFFANDNGLSTVVPFHNADLKRSLIRLILTDIQITVSEYEKLRRNI